MSKTKLKAEIEADLAAEVDKNAELSKSNTELAAEVGELRAQLAAIAAVERAGVDEQQSPGQVSVAVSDDALAEFVAACRQQFAPEMIGKLPKGYCKMCAEKGVSQCPDHHWVNNCPECGGSHSSAITFHADFVGHAHVTARLLNIDPVWNWEPVAWATDGTPLIKLTDTTAMMWIRLTIGGITRLGVGTAPRRKDDMLKELIGDAIRNAAMRFGIALDLWAKGELEEPIVETWSGDADLAEPVPGLITDAQKGELQQAVKAIEDVDARSALRVALRSKFPAGVDQIPSEEFETVMEMVTAAAEPAAEPEPAEQQPEPEDESDPPADGEDAPPEQPTSDPEPFSDPGPPPADPESPADPQGEVTSLERQVTDRFLKFKGEVANQVKVALEDADLWPLSLVDNDAMREEVLAIFDEVEAGQS